MKSLTVSAAAIALVSLVWGQIPTEGLVAYYPFDNDVEPMVYDASGNNAHGIFMGVPFYGDGIVGKAIDLDGIESYVDIGNADGLFDFTDQITLMAWVYQRDAGNGQHNEWISKGDHAWCLKHRLDPFYEFFIYDNTWVVCRVTDAEEIMSHNDQWHHFAGTYDGQYLTLYVDGEWRAETEHTGSIALTDYGVCLGTNTEYLDRLFDGKLDEVRIYNVALNEAQVKAIYNANLTEAARKTKEPSEFCLQQNYPNPFNAATQITYSLPQTCRVRLDVCDIGGRHVATLIDGVQTQGPHRVNFKADALPSGIYLYRLQAGDQWRALKKMMLIK